ncbi:uncharacterized protein LOC111909241 [Lactuca sativa]|uniref:uncharacterized protein LOC111909241 n=1 Tax=Lactuca sativa TaxID=4236 RepID=UPI000CD997A8|nr:uncharacterized protein LOC111909241 [Lactuca sativa]
MRTPTGRSNPQPKDPTNRRPIPNRIITRLMPLKMKEKKRRFLRSLTIFSVDVSGVIYAMQDLGDKARWLKRDNKSTTWKDKSKWCAYHEDFVDMMEDCIALRKEISYLLIKGHLKEILGRKREKSKENCQDGHRILEKPGSPPADAKIINVISGGSNIRGTSYSQAKRHMKVSKKKEYIPQRNTMFSSEKEITFDETDREGIQDRHHDKLVITLYMANHFIRRILVDGGSSVNIVLLDTLKRRNIPKLEIIKRSSALIGFSKETKHTIGEIKLPIYIDETMDAQDDSGSINIPSMCKITYSMGNSEDHGKPTRIERIL